MQQGQKALSGCMRCSDAPIVINVRSLDSIRVIGAGLPSSLISEIDANAPTYELGCPAYVAQPPPCERAGHTDRRRYELESRLAAGVIAPAHDLGTPWRRVTKYRVGYRPSFGRALRSPIKSSVDACADPVHVPRPSSIVSLKRGDLSAHRAKHGAAQRGLS